MLTTLQRLRRGVVAIAVLVAPAANVQFAASDGFKLTADYYAPEAVEVEGKSAPPAPLAILLHMYRSDRSAWAPLAEKLREAGFAVVAVDMRGHGDSAAGDSRERVMARDPKIFAEMRLDAEAAYGWAVKQPGVDPSRVVLVGASVGCSVALRTAAADPSVDALVLMTPGLNYLGLDSAVDIEKVEGRAILMLATEGEREAADTLSKKRPKRGRSLVVGPGVVHGTRMFGEIDGIEDRIVDFLKREVGGPAVRPVIVARGSDTFFEPDAAEAKAIPEADRRVLSSAQEAIGRGLKPADSRPGE